MAPHKRILLVEDDPNDVELVLEALDEYRLTNEVVTARGGQEALDYLLHRGTFAQRPGGDPVAILLDLKMPSMDGVELLRRVKADAHLRSIPIVVLTSSCEPGDLEECYELGVNAYVVKPVRFGAFVDAVKQIGGFWAHLNEPPPATTRSV